MPIRGVLSFCWTMQACCATFVFSRMCCSRSPSKRAFLTRGQLELGSIGGPPMSTDLGVGGSCHHSRSSFGQFVTSETSLIRWTCSIARMMHFTTTVHTIGIMSIHTPSSGKATHERTTLGTGSLVLGICSLIAGWTFAAPIIGIVLGLMSYRREPKATRLAVWGIVLNAVALITWVIMVVVFVVSGSILFWRGGH